jgi:tetratricopeptide (TPR) repeat protein
MLPTVHLFLPEWSWSGIIGSMNTLQRYRIVLLVIVLACSAASTVSAGETVDRTAQAYYMRGSFMESGGDLVLAYTYYTYAEKYEPDNARIFYALARVTLEMGKYDETRKYAGRLVEKGIYDANARLMLAEVEYEENNKDKALELLDSIKDNEDVPRFEVYKFMARIYLENEDYTAARGALEKAREIDPGDLFVHYRLGLIYADTGNPDKAVESLKEAIAVNPGFAGSHLALGTILLHYGDPDGAIEAFEDVASLDPGNRTAVTELSRLYLERGRLEEGVELLEPLYNARDLGESGKLMLGRFYYGLGRDDDALTVFRALLATLGEKPQIMRAIAEIEMDRGNFRTAYEYLDRLIEIEPDRFNNYVGLVLIANGLAGDPSSPEEDKKFSSVEGTMYLKEAVQRMDRTRYSDNFIIGTVYRKIGDNERAEHFLTAAEELSPEARDVLVELAALYEDMGRLDEAIDRIRIVHGNEPEDASINNFYGYLLAVRGDSLDFAEELVKKALAGDPANGYYLDSLGWVKFKKGEFSEALRILVGASEIVVDDPVIWEHIGDTYMELGQPELAVESYTKSAEVDPDRPVIEEKMNEARNAASRAEKKVD